MNEEQNDEIEEYKGPSKSQLKRDALALVDLGEKLLDIPVDQLMQLSDSDIVEAVQACKKIKKGNARKRQLQYIGKLLRKIDTSEIRAVIDRFDASSHQHAMQFHQLEQWREALIENDPSVISTIKELLPDIDLQHLRQLVRNAQKERSIGKEPPIHFRKLFQYLKSEVDT